MASLPTKYQEPRMSVNDLALYMVSSDTARLGILKRNKYPKKPPMIRYRDVRPPIVAYLADLARNVQPLLSAEKMFSQRSEDASEGSLRQDDARQSIEVLHAVLGMRNQLGGISFTAAPKNQERLMISGVRISCHLDLHVQGSARGLRQVGGAILRMTQDDAETDSAKAKRREMGLFVASLIRIHVEQNLPHSDLVSNKLCMSIDIRHGEVFAAPSSNARRMSDLDSACTFVAAIWHEL